jgi:5'-methylthioadenosine phosphorylase
MKQKFFIGLIGGYGLEKVLRKKQWRAARTPYGYPSSKIVMGVIADKRAAIICRHGENHSIPPHRINHLANIWTLHSLGIEFIINTAAAGSLNEKIKPGSFILPHDFIDFRFQPTTFYHQFKNEKGHTDMTAPYSVYLREKIQKAAKNLGIPVRNRAVYINTLGPRFETPTEIRMFKKMGADIVGMTNVPEVILANELGIEIAAVAIATNFAAGISKNSLTSKEVDEMMAQKEKQLKNLILETVRIL